MLRHYLYAVTVSFCFGMGVGYLSDFNDGMGGGFICMAILTVALWIINRVRANG